MPVSSHGQLLLPQGGFQAEMNRREAAQILGVRESAAEVRSLRLLMVSRLRMTSWLQSQHSVAPSCGR